MAEPNTSSTGGSTARPTSTDPSTQSSTGGGTSATQRDDRQSSGRPGIVNRVKESATAQLTTQRDRGIDAIGNVTEAVRSSTQRLRDQRHDKLATYVERAADQIDDWTRRMREKDVDELLGDVQRFARRQPAVFIGSAFALGVVAARFLKSSRPQHGAAYASGSRRGRYGGAAAVSTAADRPRYGSEGTVATGTRSVAIPDSDTISSGTAGDVGGSRPGSKTRRSTTRTER